MYSLQHSIVVILLELSNIHLLTFHMFARSPQNMAGLLIWIYYVTLDIQFSPLVERTQWHVKRYAIYQVLIIYWYITYIIIHCLNIDRSVRSS